MGASSSPLVKVRRGDALGGAADGNGLITGRESFEAFNPLTVGARERTGAK